MTCNTYESLHTMAAMFIIHGKVLKEAADVTSCRNSSFGGRCTHTDIMAARHTKWGRNGKYRHPGMGKCRLFAAGESAVYLEQCPSRRQRSYSTLQHVFMLDATDRSLIVSFHVSTGQSRAPDRHGCLSPDIGLAAFQQCLEAYQLCR